MECTSSSNVFSRNLFFLVSICLALFPLDLAASSLALKNYTGIECGQSDVFQEHEMCGVDFYRASSSANCPSVFENRQQESCGVAAYITAATAFCGIESYNEGPSRACPGYLSRHEKVITGNEKCPPGYTEHNKISNFAMRASICRREEHIPRCRLPDFGVLLGQLIVPRRNQASG
jgi:hypothetical protein